jgi:hypothetical protein
MDLDYMQKYTFPSTITGGSGGMPFMTDSSILTSSLVGGGTGSLAIPGGLIFQPFMGDVGSILEKDPWEVKVREDFDSLLDLVSVSASSNKNKTVKIKKVESRKSLLKN